MAFAPQSPKHTTHSKIRQNSNNRGRKSTRSKLAHRTPMRNRPLTMTMRIPVSAPYALRIADHRATNQFENLKTQREAERRERQRMRDQFIREENARKERLRLAEMAHEAQMEIFKAQREAQQREREVYDAREIAREQKEREERRSGEEKDARYCVEDRHVNYVASGYHDRDGYGSYHGGYNDGFPGSPENRDGYDDTWGTSGQGASADEDNWEDDAGDIGYAHDRRDMEDENGRREMMDLDDDENDDDRNTP